MNIESLTVGECREIARLFGSAPPAVDDKSAWKIGVNYFIRTVTMTQTGRLVQVTPLELVLEDAAWVADTGRFSNALQTETFDEVEPFPTGRVIVGRTAVVDACEIKTLPRAVK